MRRWIYRVLFCCLTFYFTIPALAEEPVICHPVITGVQYDVKFDVIVTGRMSTLMAEDQAIRQPITPGPIDYEAMIAGDLARREEVLGYLQAGKIVLDEDLFRAALIFQHGDCPEHYALAAELALRSFEGGYLSAGGLYTAAVDRHLQSIGELQKYGTQYVIGLDAKFHLCPVTGEVTDLERAKYGLPSLAALDARSAELDTTFPQTPGPIALLTHIPGAGAALNTEAVRLMCGPG